MKFNAHNTNKLNNVISGNQYFDQFISYCIIIFCNDNHFIYTMKWLHSAKTWPVPRGLFSGLTNMLYPPKYGEISLAIIVLSQILDITNFFDGLKTNHNLKISLLRKNVFKNC